MGEFEITGGAAGITVTGTDQARAALMQYEMGACLAGATSDPATHGAAYDPGRHDELMAAAGQLPAGD